MEMLKKISFKKFAHLIIFFYVGFFASVLSSNALTEMKPLNSILTENPKAQSDLPTIQYIMSRCAALNAAIAKAFINETDPKNIAIGEKYHASYEKFASIAIKISITEYKSQSEGAKNASEMIVLLSNIYVERMKDGRLRFGSFMEDIIVKADLPICNDLQKH